MKKNLVIVVDPRLIKLADIQEIAQEIILLDQEIAVYVISPGHTAQIIRDAHWRRKSLTVMLGPPANFVPRRGPVFATRPIEKLDQYTRFLTANIATPKTARFELGAPYSESDWSEFVILKPLPLTLSSQKGWSHLYRTRRLPYLSLSTLPADHFLHQCPGLVQTFIDTGANPWKWRVLSFFGEPLYSTITRSAVERASLESSDDEIEQSIIDAKNPQSTAADITNTRNRLAVDEEVLQFAKRIHAAFPRIPVLGIDILKREQDGKLFAIEVNAGGNVWHFSSGKEKHRQRLGGRQAMIDQLGAWTVAAKVLIRLTHKNAA